MKTVHLSRIDLNLFVVFDAIYTEGGITRASKRLSLTQPAISHALGRLRELFEDPLFIRQSKAMIPTPLARVMIDPVRQSLRGFEATLKRVDRFDPATAQKHFTVGMRDVRELTMLPNLLRSVTRALHRSSTSRSYAPNANSSRRSWRRARSTRRSTFAWHYPMKCGGSLSTRSASLSSHGRVILRSSASWIWRPTCRRSTSW